VTVVADAVGGRHHEHVGQRPAGGGAGREQRRAALEARRARDRVGVTDAVASPRVGVGDRDDAAALGVDRQVAGVHVAAAVPAADDREGGRSWGHARA
jgi:hypothetical protein